MRGTAIRICRETKERDVHCTKRNGAAIGAKCATRGSAPPHVMPTGTFQMCPVFYYQKIVCHDWTSWRRSRISDSHSEELFQTFWVIVPSISINSTWWILHFECTSTETSCLKLNLASIHKTNIHNKLKQPKLQSLSDTTQRWNTKIICDTPTKRSSTMHD